ncbi:hypothetical protein [Bacteroides hominis]|uniref:hypothetical protein n=1 Tax=Bacteroides hominis TaxID=2763023 RepID=UPI00164A9E3E|nr:hypothetical protein [Bacteroides hominis (ex Liu et al. 2022)]MBC5614553.1 hypothetical protein [Bacteroides hominis (ex Liu et al. 2022)]
MENIDTYIIILALVIACCSLIAVLFICLHTRRVRREYNMNIVKQLREKDYVSAELERMRLERDTLEKVLRINLLETIENSGTNNNIDTNDCEKHVLRIDITYVS